MRAVIVHATRPATENVERLSLVPSSWGPLEDAPDGSPLAAHRAHGAASWVREVGASVRIPVVETIEQLDEAMGAVMAQRAAVEPFDNEDIARSSHRPAHR